MKTTEKVRLCKGHNSPLLNCIGDVRESEFFNSWSKFSDGKVPYCKNCVQKIYEYFLNETKSEKNATYFISFLVKTIYFIAKKGYNIINKAVW